MLILSMRQTEADLALWTEMEAADASHGRSAGVARKTERSREAIAAFLAAGPAYLSVSFGKDSVALAHMAIESGFAGPLVHLRAIPYGNPETTLVRDAFLVSHPGIAYDERAVDYRDIPPGRGWEAVEREKDRRFFAAFPAGRYLSGIRADESAGRRIRMRKWGLMGPSACAPLGWWTANDVFGYLAANGLPVHPSYAMLGGGRWSRKDIRVDELGGARGDQFGRATWEREYYGDVLRRLEAIKGQTGPPPEDRPESE